MSAPRAELFWCDSEEGLSGGGLFEWRVGRQQRGGLSDELLWDDGEAVILGLLARLLFAEGLRACVGTVEPPGVLELGHSHGLSFVVHRTRIPATWR